MINIHDDLLDLIDERELWLLVQLTRRINASRESWPSNEQQQKDTRWKDIKKLRDVRRTLVKKGLIAIAPRFDKDGQTSNKYTILTPLLGVYIGADRLQEMTSDGEDKTDRGGEKWTGGGRGKNGTTGGGENGPGGRGKNGPLSINHTSINHGSIINPPSEDLTGGGVIEIPIGFEPFDDKSDPEKEKNSAQKEKEEPVSFPYLMWSIWSRHHMELHGFEPDREAKHFRALKLLRGRFIERLKSKGALPHDYTLIDQSVLTSFDMFLSLLRESGDKFYLENFTPDIFLGKFLNIIQKLQSKTFANEQRIDKYTEALRGLASE